MKVAPVLLWLVAIFIPVMIGRNIYLDTFKQDQGKLAAMSRNHLMNRARELEARLTPDQILKQQLRLTDYANLYRQIDHKNSLKPLADSPIGRALMTLNGNTEQELASFSSFLSRHTGINPLFVAGLNSDPLRCGLHMKETAGFTAACSADYREEFSNMCQLLNKRSYFFENEPYELRHLAPFSFFSKFLGIFEPFNTHFWHLNGSFSVRYHERLFNVIMRPPYPDGQGSNILVGILPSRLSPRLLLKHTCAAMSDNDIKITFGRSEATNLPVFLEESKEMSMIMRLPELFREGFKLQADQNHLGKLVLKLSIPTGARKNIYREHTSRLNLATMFFLSLTLLLGAGISLGQLNLRTNLVRLITAAFFVSMFLPLSGLAWLGAANSRTSRATEAQQIVQMVRQKLRQCETAFFLQRYRQQLLMFYVSRVIANLSPDRWEEYVNRFFFNDPFSPFKAHFNNFYLYSAAKDRDYFRGQNPKDRFRPNELPNILSGAFRRAIMHAGAFDHLSEAARNKVAQVADFSSGVMEELVDDNFFSKVLSTPGELNNTTLIARQDLIGIFFLRGVRKMVGMLCLVTNNFLPTMIIDEINGRGSFKRHFTLLNQRVELDFFVINEFQERRLYARSNDYYKLNIPATSFVTADALYSNSDVSNIDNLHLDPPHLLVTDTILDRSIFAVAKIHMPAQQFSENAGQALLAIIAIASCLALAAGISKLILMPVPPFLEALRELEKNRYDWVLNLQTGDEFDQLATSINNMKVSLLERRKMLQLVSQTAAEAVKSGENTENSPQRRSATILFSDIRGFTSISENNTAEEVVEMLNSYFTLMCPAVEENGGYIDKLIGDAIQAVFVSDIDQERVLGAARAALEIRRRLAVFNADRKARGLFTINNGIGIASGLVTTGLTGSRTGKLEAAVMGEPLQNAAVLESQSKFASNTCIIIDKESCNAIKDQVRVATLTINEPDSKQSITITELLGV